MSGTTASLIVPCLMPWASYIHNIGYNLNVRKALPNTSKFWRHGIVNQRCWGLEKQVCSSPFAWPLATWYWVGYVQIMYEKQFQGCHGTTIRFQSIDTHLEDNSCILGFDTFFPWVEMAIVHVLGNVKDESCFSSLAFLNSKLRAILNPHLPLVVGMYNQKFFTLENFPYTTTFVAWIGAPNDYGVIA